MPAEIKMTVDFYPQWCIEQDDEIRDFEKEFGVNGIAFLHKLRQSLGKFERHTFIAGDDSKEWRVLLKNSCQKEADALAMMEALSNISYVDKTLWQEKKIIWSQGYVDNLVSVYSQRNFKRGDGRDTTPTKPNLLDASITMPNHQESMRTKKKDSNGSKKKAKEHVLSQTIPNQSETDGYDLV